MMPLVFARFKNKQNVEDIGRQIGNQKAECAVDDEVAPAKRFGDRCGRKVEQFDEDIVRRQRREGEPCEQEKNNHVDAGGDASANAVFEELDKRVVFF